MTDYIDVKSFDGLYDEKCEAVLHNIVSIEHCWKHKFINGSLRFEKAGYFIGLESEAKPNFNPEWGTGYGGIRYCKTCKLIDCIHLWETTSDYRMWLSDFYFKTLRVSLCRICKKRISRGGGSVHQPSIEAWDIISKIAKELGKPVPSIDNGYGSMWLCEFPSGVSQVLKDSGVEAAESYARNAFNYGLR